MKKTKKPSKKVVKNQTTQKPQLTIPASIIPHALLGLARFIKVGFDKIEVETAKALQLRFIDLAKKKVGEHRMRLNRLDAVSFRNALVIEAEYRVGGLQTPDPLILPVADYLKAYINEQPLPKLLKAIKPIEAVIEAGVTDVAELVAENVEPALEPAPEAAPAV
jgi:hypothetical protein